jgi:hypothetical protein
VQHADAEYRVEFGWRGEDGRIQIVGETGPTRTPPESISPQWDTQFATVPFHLGFNFLLDVIDAAKATGEPLTQALARLQQTAAANLGGPSSWSEPQLRVLETLLGKAFVEQLSSMSSEELTNYLRADLAAQLDSESASELLAKGRLAQLLAPEASSMFSAFRQIFGGELSSAGLSNVNLSSAAVSSAGQSSETLAASSESLASWQKAAGSETRLQEVGLSSAEIAAGSETRLQEVGLSSFEITGGLSSAELSSGILSSFAGASELSALGLSSAELTSSALSSGAWSGVEFPLSSWSESAAPSSGASELGAFGLSSAELTSSALSSAAWSGLEFPLSSWSELASESSLSSGFVSSWGGPVERGFFMHVNAEVIFYGGTDPRAKVTVAGQPIQLQPDGSFRYHFKFPDSDFEIPIVAVSPDGKETRSAVLFFRRDTSRQGEVGATNQPAHLDDPMGAKR